MSMAPADDRQIAGSQSVWKGNLSARLDRLPWGRFHTIVTCALALGWALDSFENTVIGSVLGQIKAVWSLTPTQSSALISSWVLGIFVGAILFGHYADRTGRKKMFIFTLVWYAGFSVITAFSWNFYSLLLFRFLAALGVGGEYSAVTAAMVEFIPQRHRGKSSGLIMAGSSVGSIASSLFAAYFLNHFAPGIGWRLGFAAGAVLAVAGVWVRYAIPESPRWLATHGYLEQAERIVCRVEQSLIDSGAQLPPVEAEVQPLQLTPPAQRHSFIHGIRELFTEYASRMWLACSTNFAQASVIYGIMVLLSVAILPALHVPPTHMPEFYFIGNVAGLCGGLVAAWLVDAWGRKGTVLLGFSLTTLAVVCLCFVSTWTAVMATYSLLMFSVIWSANVGYIVTSEILPVRNRATGLGVSVGAGRIGAFVAPLLLTAIYQHTQQPSVALLCLALLSLPGPIAAVWWCFRGTEASNVALEEISRETLDVGLVGE
jgi:MFS family permease